LTGIGAFFGTFRRFLSCQKRRSLLRRDHPLRSGAPRRPRARAKGGLVGALGVFSFFAYPASTDLLMNQYHAACKWP
jgi:hypothetical protein